MGAASDARKHSRPSIHARVSTSTGVAYHGALLSWPPNARMVWSSQASSWRGIEVRSPLTQSTARLIARKNLGSWRSSMSIPRKTCRSGSCQASIACVRTVVHARPSGAVNAAALMAYSSPVMRPHTILMWHVRSRRTFWASAIAWASSASISFAVAICVDDGSMRNHAVARSSVTVSPSARIL